MTQLRLTQVSYWRSLFLYFGSAGLSLLIACVVLQLWKADLSIPFGYEWRDLRTAGHALDPIGSGDTLLFCAMTKGMEENGWFLHNRFIGMPTGLELYDYPFGDNLHFLILKLLSLVTPNYAVTFNLFFLLTFPFTTLTALWTLRQVGITTPAAISISILYTFLPYHFLRGEQHIFLASYYIVPLTCLIMVWVLNGEPLWQTSSNVSLILRITQKGWISLICCTLTAASGIYYALFGAILILATAIRIFDSRKPFKSLVSPIILSGFVTFALMLNLWPTIAYHFQHGPNPVATFRLPAEAETHGLKIVQLLLPVCQHRIKMFSDLAVRYFTQAPLVAENATACLGLIGSTGFLLLLAWQLGIKRTFAHTRLLNDLSALNLVALLVATIGGFGSFFAFVVSPILRCYNRMSIYIAFYSLLAVALVLDAILRRTKVPRVLSPLMQIGIVTLTTIMGLADQTSGAFEPLYMESAASFENDREFISRLEASVPVNAMIFQLPYVPFPAGVSVGDYQLLRGYLHSKTLRWSYGSMKGRESDAWVRGVLSLQDVRQISRTLMQYGFAGIYMDRAYFPQNKEVEKVLKEVVDANPIASRNDRLLFFNFAKMSQTP